MRLASAGSVKVPVGACTAPWIAIDAVMALETDQQRALPQGAVGQHRRFCVLLDLAAERLPVLVEQGAEPRARLTARPGAVVDEIGAEPAADIGDREHALPLRVHDEGQPAAEVHRRGGQHHAAAELERTEAFHLRPVALEMRNWPRPDFDGLDARGRRRVLFLGADPPCGSQHGARSGQKPAQHCPAIGTGQPVRVSHDGSRSHPTRRCTSPRLRWDLSRFASPRQQVERPPPPPCLAI
jgi:hypothetical protein